MTIAVSGSEGIAYLAPQGLSSLIHKRNFPQNIALAVTAITTSAASPTLSSLSRAAKSVLAFVVRLAERADPTQPSWAFKATIAQEIGASESTVYRGLNELAEAGLIERLKQERKTHNGRLFVSRLKLTKKACACLGLFNTRCKKHYAPDFSRKENAKREFQKPAQQAASKQEEATVLESTTTDTTPQTAPHVVLSPILPSSETFISSKDSDIDTALETEGSVLHQAERNERDSDPLTSPQEAHTAPNRNTTYTESVEPKKASVAASQGRVIHRVPSINLTDGINTLSPIDQKQSIQKQPGQPRDFSVKIANRRIPSDLTWLVQDNCLSVTGLLH
ncbi:helix-turn-helix domain-containing protein, partial [Candidatus Glomeribacter gigasporarum]|uniref:helix-turn-helix domain-containing protein n=1 Tax=Candidatus Glomeribacter gigasporarum TaxID=132144 RepID=UPI0005B267DB